MAKEENDPNCAEPACFDKASFFKSAMGKPGSSKKTAELPKDCPVDRQELGNSTWKLLHSMGIYYPENPSKEHQEKTKVFIEALALMYPCSHCAADFQDSIQQSPPRVDSKTSLSQWLCEQHNIVNKKIGKPVFDCSMESLEKRWRKGRPECWGKDSETSEESLGQD